MTTRPGYVWDATASAWVEIGQAAVVSPIAYQASQPSSPATGDIWIDSDDEVPSVDSTLYYRWTKTMSGGETSLSGTDNNSLALKYTAGYESVFINGVLQVRGLDYVATTGTTVTGLTALTASDVVMVESIVAYSTGDTYTQSQMTSLLDAKSPVSTTGLVLLNTTTFSAVSSVSINSVFNSTYDNYKIIYSNVNISTSSQNAFVRLRASGTDLSTTTYHFGGTDVTTTATTISAVSSNSAGDSEIYVGAPSVTNKHSIEIELYNPFNSALKSFFIRSTRDGFGIQVSGYNTTATPFDGLTFYPSANNITGTIKVYGYK